ncbi:MAG: ankyrin repeat domain-containing protein [Armatimonadetes bacterium]|nr:ankyrin repeat domain-containing protein [Armatimonadota bacterium]
MSSPQTSLFEQIGGMEACRRLSAAFHDRVAGDPILAPMFPKDLARATEHLALYLAEKLGGPDDYTARRGKQSLRCRHAHLPIGSPEAHAWLDLMFASVDAIGISEPARQALHDFFIGAATGLSDPLRDLYRLPLDELRPILTTRPALATEADTGRTLLAEAAGRWDVPRVELLLEVGSDVQTLDSLGHNALYRAANAQWPGREAEGRAVVELLIEHGADVIAAGGPGRITALHAAARRGMIKIAEALLAAGADIEAPDAKGETPLRRAVNCGKEPMVRLLLAHGADPRSQDKHGKTALDAARTEAVRAMLVAAAAARQA